MSTNKYILRDGKPVLADDLMEWASWYETSADARKVERTQIGDSSVSTVFLSIDHNFTGDGPPLLYETMVFGGPMNQEMDRYATLEQAKEGHAAMVKRVKDAA